MFLLNVENLHKFKRKKQQTENSEPLLSSRSCQSSFYKRKSILHENENENEIDMTHIIRCAFDTTNRSN